MKGLRPRLHACFGLFLAVCWLCIGNPPTGATPTAPDAAAATSFAAAVGGSPFGLDTHIATRFGIYGRQSGPMDMAQGTGAGWIREEVRWDWIQHPIGAWDWGFTDEMVQDARSRNLNILGLLGYNNSAQKAGTVNFTVPDIGLWKTFVLNTVYRYKDRIHVWEVWNEPDNPYFWNGSVADYVNLLRETYNTIKSVDPAAVVMNGASSNLDLNWFNQFLDQGGAQYADILGFHPYPSQASIDNGDYQKNDLAHLTAIQARTGKSWWFTEIGWSSASGSGVGSEQAQASYMVRQYVESLDYPGLDVRHIFWYDFHDDGTDPGNAENNYGLIRNDWATPEVLLSGLSADGRAPERRRIAGNSGFRRGHGLSLRAGWHGRRCDMGRWSCQPADCLRAGAGVRLERESAIGGGERGPDSSQHWRRSGLCRAYGRGRARAAAAPGRPDLCVPRAHSQRTAGVCQPPLEQIPLACHSKGQQAKARRHQRSAEGITPNKIAHGFQRRISSGVRVRYSYASTG